MNWNYVKIKCCFFCAAITKERAHLLLRQLNYFIAVVEANSFVNADMKLQENAEEILSFFGGGGG